MSKLAIIIIGNAAIILSILACGSAGNDRPSQNDVHKAEALRCIQQCSDLMCGALVDVWHVRDRGGCVCTCDVSVHVVNRPE